MIFLLCLALLLGAAFWLRPRHPGLSPNLNNARASVPGLGWVERYLGGSPEAEAALIHKMGGQINHIQRRNKYNGRMKKRGHGFHEFGHAGVKNAKFVTDVNLPAHLHTKLFQPGVEVDATVRLSNASGMVQDDTAADLRGIAVRMGGYDFLATNGESSHARDAWQFMQFALAAAGLPIPLLPQWLVSIINKVFFIPALLWRAGVKEGVRMLKTAAAQASRPVESLRSEDYFSRSPVAINNYAGRFRWVNQCTGVHFVGKSPRYLREELIESLKKGDTSWVLVFDPWIDEVTTPIEDGSVVWSKDHAIVLGKLTIPQQDLTSPEAEAVRDEVDAIEFNPHNLLEDMKVLSSLNRARGPVYRTSVAFRKGAENQGVSRCPVTRLFRFCFGWMCPGKAEGAASVAPPTSGGGCPFHAGNGGGKEGDSQFRPQSSRQGIGPWKYVWWNAFYWVLQTLNRMLARDPNRKVSWDKWPPYLGLLYLLAKIRFNRSNALTDPYDYKTNDNKPVGPEPEKAKHFYTADGTWVSDNDNPQMGAENTRFGSNIPPSQVRPDVEEMEPSARDVGSMRWRKLDENGEEIVKPALIMNELGEAWIQEQFHGFGGNTKRDHVSKCPHLLRRRPSDNWPGDVAQVDRTSADHTRVTENGRPTVINERTAAWVQAQTYGTNEDELSRLRSFKGGKLRLNDDGSLPEDPVKPGVDLVGFSHNYNPKLSLLHWLFVLDHNAICDHYAYFHPEWSDEALFDYARKVNVGHIDRIHTTEWTEDLLQHETLQLAMHQDWYGPLGQKGKMWVMRMCHRHKWFARLMEPLRHYDVLWGMAGSKWEHHDGPFQLPVQFRMVYRLHEMVLGRAELKQVGSDRTLARIDLLNFIHENTRPVVEKYGYDVLCWSFVRRSCGALTLHNFPRALTRFQNMQDGTLTDLAERDIFRERTDGTGTYNQFRKSLGEPPVTSFMELCGGDAEMARELEIKYHGDVNKVDAGIGILVEPKPEGFALGFCQFYQFVLNAPRRVKSNRHLTDGFNYDEYQEGMDWVEHSGGMLGMIQRHLPTLCKFTEGVTRTFTPWKDVETFPERMLDETHTSTANVVKSDLRSFGIGAVAGLVAVLTGAASLTTVLLLLALMLVIPTWLTVRRMLAMRFMQLCWKKCYTDRRGMMFGTLSRAEHSLDRAAHFGRLQAGAVMGIGGVLALAFASTNPWLAMLLGLVSFSGIFTWKWSNRFASQAHMAKIALRNRMRDGQTEIKLEDLSGATVLEKRSRFSQEGIDFNERLFTADGGVDEKEFERLCRTYSPGRLYFTEYDFARMHEGQRAAEAKEGKGNWFTRWMKERSNRRKTATLLHLYGDRVVEEDRHLVPAISHEMLRNALHGTAQANVEREMREGDVR